jgi:3-dehydroquinate dehydratase type I
MICASIKAKKMAEVIDKLEKVPNLYDLVEIWINEIQDLDLEKLKQKAKNLLIIKITDVSDKDLMERISELNFNYVDIDVEDLKKFSKKHNSCKIIGSYHDFKKTPDLKNAQEITKKIYSHGADIAKVIFYAQECEDNFVPLKLIENTKKPIISFCMGEKGRISRFLGVQCGCLINYVAPDASWKTAEGQFTLDEWKKVQTVLLR